VRTHSPREERWGVLPRNFQIKGGSQQGIRRKAEGSPNKTSTGSKKKKSIGGETQTVKVAENHRFRAMSGSGRGRIGFLKSVGAGIARYDVLRQSVETQKKTRDVVERRVGRIPKSWGKKIGEEQDKREGREVVRTKEKKSKERSKKGVAVSRGESSSWKLRKKATQNLPDYHTQGFGAFIEQKVNG